MTEPTKAKGEPPIIRGYTRDGQTPAEITLWINTPKPGEEAAANAPDFRGYIQAGQEKVYVSAWAYAGGESKEKKNEDGTPKTYPPYLSLAASIKDDNAPGGFRSESLEGSIKGMFRTTVNNEKIDVDGSRGLKVIGELKGQSVLKEGVTLSGNLNGRFPDQETVLGLASSLGFADAPVNGFKAYIDADAKKAAAPRA
jgi:hypothetical protein